ncbi:hypothetical protein JCM11641_005698 [Rhodosporidiobolus odoratus]
MATATATRPGTVSASSTLSRPNNDPRLRLLNLLVLTALGGTTWSVLSTSAATTAFRSRLPAYTLTRLTSSERAFPVPSLPYFADKRNSLNQLFVKRSWGWVTAIFLVLSLLIFLFHPHHPSTTTVPTESSREKKQSASATPVRPTTAHLLTTLRRYLLATLFWFYLTQATWFGTRLGPSISHRILRSSGATCIPAAMTSQTSGAGGGLHADGPNDGIPACTGAKGEYWRGGHDVSGHAFMMVHAALFLFEILLPLLPSLYPFLFSSSSAAASAAAARPRMHPIVAAVGYAASAVLVLCWWMLLMTSLFFHSPAEKLTGVAFGLVGWWVSGL